MTRLRLNFGCLNEHKFRHRFKDTVDLMCKCGLETEKTLHFLLCCRLYSTVRKELIGDRYAFSSSLTNYPDQNISNILLYGLKHFSVLSSIQINQF